MPSKRRIDLDPLAPIASLLEAAGLTAHALGVADAAARGQEDTAAARATVYKAVSREAGGRVELHYLARLVGAAGYKLRLVAERKEGEG